VFYEWRLIGIVCSINGDWHCVFYEWRLAFAFQSPVMLQTSLSL